MNKESNLGYYIFLLLVVILFLNSNYETNKNCQTYFKQLSINGHVTRKYIDKKEHNYPILEVLTPEGSVQKINLSLDQSGLFEFVQINDSINKLSDSLRVNLVRSSVDTTFVLNRECIGIIF
jgi:hypothetical protein